MAEGGFRERHKSVSNYEANTNLGSFAANTGAGLATGGRRRSSVAFAGSVSGAAGQQGENVLNMQDETLRKMSVAVPNLAELSTDARAGADSERKMSFREGVRLYPKAMFFSFGLSLAVIMEGYDTWLLGNFFGMEAFAKKYGGPAGIVDGVQTYQISATWQTAISNSTAAAQIIGLFFNGIISERIGYRKTMMGALFAITCFIFVTFFAVNIHMLLAGYVLSGLPWYVKSLCFLEVQSLTMLFKGHLPNSDHDVCCRGYSGHASTILDYLCQLVLGHWPADRIWYSQRFC